MLSKSTRNLSILLCAISFGAVQGEQPASQEKAITRNSSPIVAGTNSMDVLDTSRRLGAGDRLSYRVVEERREPIPLVVADSGELEVPLIGRLSAAGRTCKELAQAIKPMLEREYFFKATVIVGLDAVSARARGHVYVSGQVRQQGALEIPPDEHFTLSKAILKAGGFADFANKRKIRLIRKGANGSSETTIVDLVEIIDRGHIDKDPELHPDDTIIVPEKYVNL